jgi:hypothetical protein
MSDDNGFGGYDNTDQTGQQQQSKSEGGGLRAKLEEALARAKAAEDKLAETEKNLNARTVSELFQKFGVPDKVKKFYAGDPTEEAVTAWVKENAEVFGISLPGAEATETPEDKARNEALRATQAASKIGFDGVSTSAQTALGEAESKLKAGASEAELDEIIGNLFKR